MMNRRIVGVLILMMTMLAQAQPAANSIDWGFGRPGVRVVTNAPDHVVATGIASQVSSTLIASHSDVAGMHTTTEQQASWTTAAGWGPHAGLYKALGWLPDWADVQNKPYIPTAQQITDWDTAAGWGPHATAGYLKIATDTVARASIDVLSTGKVSQAQWNAGSNAFEGAIGVLSTQRVTRVWSADGTRFSDSTGVVWRVDTVTNYTVALSADFMELSYSTRPEWSGSAFPVNDGAWLFFSIEQTDYVTFNTEQASWSVNGGEYPRIMLPVVNAQGTAVVSQHISIVESPYRVFADTNQTEAIKTDLAAYVNTNLTATTAALQPSTATRYGDLRTTNTAGYAAFSITNPVFSYLNSIQATNGQSLARFRHNVTTPIFGTLSLSAYVFGYPFLNPTNPAVSASVTVYTAAGVVVAAGTGTTVTVAKNGVSNLTASVTLSATVTNGYIVAELTSRTNYASSVAYVGGAYPWTLFATVSPLGYATPDWVSANFVLKDNGVQVNPTMAGTVAMDSRTIAASVDTITATNGATVSVTYGVFTNGVDFGRCVTYLGTNFWELLK